MRPTMFLLAIVAAVGLAALGSVFGVNGRQWGWWRDAAWIEAVVVAGLGLWGPGLGRRVRIGRAYRVAGAAAGAALVAACATVMAARYSDPYSGPLLWPHALALLASGGFAAVASAILCSR